MYVCMCIQRAGSVNLRGAPCTHIVNEIFERSRSKISPLEQTRSILAKPVELTGFDGVSCDFDRGC